MWFSLRALAVALLLGTALLVGPATGPTPAVGVGPLPDCRIDDILTEPRGYDDWATTQVDWILTLGPQYRPKDLVLLSTANVAGGGYIRAVAIEDLRAMAEAARQNGTPIRSLSPFRGYKQQVALFKSYAGSTYGNFESAITYSARPGHSEHQTGLGIDFGSIGDTGLSSDWESTPAGGWMAKNAWEYGWLMSYPDGKQNVVCYRYEPWHYRYVGRDMAAKIHDSGLTITEYLWANHTQVDPACVALPAPKVVTPGKARSCAFAAPSPSPVSMASPVATSGASPTAIAATPSGGLAEPTFIALDNGSGLNVGLVLLVGVGGLAGLSVVAFLAWLVLQRRPRRNRGPTRYR